MKQSITKELIITVYDPFFKKNDILYINTKYIPCYKSIKQAEEAEERVKNKYNLSHKEDDRSCYNYILGKIMDEISWFRQTESS